MGEGILIGFGPWGRVLYPKICSILGRSVSIAVPRPGRVPEDRIPVGARLIEADPTRFPPGVDSWFIASPYATHFDWVIEGLEQGVSVFCEKPLCSSVDRTGVARAALERTACVFQVNFVDLWNPGFRKFKEVVASVGTPGDLTMSYIGPYSFASARDILWELGPHAIACALRTSRSLTIDSVEYDRQRQILDLRGSMEYGSIRIRLGVAAEKQRDHLFVYGDRWVRYDGNDRCVAEVWQQSGGRRKAIERFEYFSDPVGNALQAFHVSCANRKIGNDASVEAFMEAVAVDTHLRDVERRLG